MSVFSKIFIIVNLLLTLLLLAAMGRKMNTGFTGTYKARYKEEVAELNKVVAELKSMKDEREAQLGVLRTDKQHHAERLVDIQVKVKDHQRSRDDLKSELTEKTNKKNTLASQNAGRATEVEDTNRSEKNTSEELKKLSSEVGDTRITLHRTVNSWFATKRLREDLEAAKQTLVQQP